MTRLPDESISFQNTTGDSGMENLYVYGKLNYNFENDDISLRSINASSNISTTATITAMGALIYNDTASGNNAVCVLDFTSNKTSTSGTFTIQFPTADASNAIIRIA